MLASVVCKEQCALKPPALIVAAVLVVAIVAVLAPVLGTTNFQNGRWVSPKSKAQSCLQVQVRGGFEASPNFAEHQIFADIINISPMRKGIVLVMLPDPKGKMIF